MRKLHSIFLVIFLCFMFLIPSQVEARAEKLQDKIEQNAGNSSALKCSQIFSICAEKPKSAPSPALLPIPTMDPRSKITPTPTQVYIPPHSLNSEVLFAMINDHRQKLGLPPFEQEERLCKIAQSRGPELYDEIFVTGNMHAGFFARNIPYWMTENMINQPTEEAALNWWLNSFVHRSAIEGDYKYSCGVCYGNSCAQLFTNFIPKQSLAVSEDHQNAAGNNN